MNLTLGVFEKEYEGNGRSIMYKLNVLARTH